MKIYYYLFKNHTKLVRFFEIQNKNKKITNFYRINFIFPL
jgi:hypothetical protein